MNDGLPTTSILGIPVVRATHAEALRAIADLFDSGTPGIVCYVNAHSLNLAQRDPEYRSVLCGAPLVLNDGAGVSVAARIEGTSFPANLNGSDFNPAILRLAAERGWRVFLLGAGPGVAEEAARRLSARIGNLIVTGCREGYFDEHENEGVVTEIRASGADVLMVAMGNPRQEKWLARNLDATGARLGIGVGAFFDFTAGVVPRAPRWLNSIGMEWAFRLAQEPRRMWRRYVVGNPVFLWRVLRSRFKARGAGKLGG